MKTNVDTQSYPIDCVVFATAVMSDRFNPGLLTFNRDMLPGGVDADGKPYYWCIRVTKQGANGYEHEPDWIGSQSPKGTACSSWGGIHEGCVVTWVRVASIEEGYRRGPNDYPDSRGVKI